jgi:valyl-tRNA synthetase
MAQGRRINLNINRVVAYRKFCNKIWNSFRFSMDKFAFIKEFNPELVDPLKENFLNSWILAKLNRAINMVNNGFESFNLGDTATAFYNFWLYELCDVYLEATKPLFINGTEDDK